MSRMPRKTYLMHLYTAERFLERLFHSPNMVYVINLIRISPITEKKQLNVKYSKNHQCINKYSKLEQLRHLLLVVTKMATSL